MKRTLAIYSLRTNERVGAAIHGTPDDPVVLQIHAPVAAGDMLVVEPAAEALWWPIDYRGDLLVVVEAPAGPPSYRGSPYLPRAVNDYEPLPLGWERTPGLVARIVALRNQFAGGAEHYAIGIWDAQRERMRWRAVTWDIVALAD